MFRKFFKKKRQEVEKTFFQIKEEEFCFDEDELEKYVTERDIEYATLIDNLNYFKIGCRGDGDISTRFNEFYIATAFQGSYIGIEFKGIPIFSASDGAKVEKHIRCQHKWFLPYLKYFCDYIDDMVKENKQRVRDENDRRLREESEKLLCEVKRMNCSREGANV